MNLTLTMLEQLPILQVSHAPMNMFPTFTLFCRKQVILWDCGFSCYHWSSVSIFTIGAGVCGVGSACSGEISQKEKI